MRKLLAIMLPALLLIGCQSTPSEPESRFPERRNYHMPGTYRLPNGEMYETKPRILRKRSANQDDGPLFSSP